MAIPAGHPRAHCVVIPFGVPPAGRGLGLGLAALVHGFAQVDGESVALAQLLARTASGGADASFGAAATSLSAASASGSADTSLLGAGAGARGGTGGAAAGPVETFLPPHAWRDLAAQGDAPPGVRLVVTGALEPPREGPGLLELLAFDARDGMTRARVEAHLDDAHAGRAVLGALEELCRTVGGDVGTLRDLADLDWDALESVLRGERCLLHDPRRGGPHDRLAAMMHLGRAVEDAPAARFPAGRLAAIAIDTAVNGHDAKLASAALRALERAAEDAPAQTDLREACAALHVRLGNADAAEAGALAAIATEPTRARLYALLSEARRARGDVGGALAAVQRGLEVNASDAVLLTERGVILAAEEDLTGARAAWEQAVAIEPIFPPAFTNLATLVLKTADTDAAQALVDRALASRAPHAEVLRRAIQLALTTEADGLARAARVASLARALLVRVPGDAWAGLTLARALVQMGERDAAKAALVDVEETSTGTAFAAEAQRARFALEDPTTAQAVESVLRAACSARPDELPVVAARAQRLAADHAIWVPCHALGMAEKRQGSMVAARQAFENAVARASGCAPAHVELVAVCLALGDRDAAVLHGVRARSLEESPRTLCALGTALATVGRLEEAHEAATRALALDGEDPGARELMARLRGTSPADAPAPDGPRRPSGLFAWLAGALGRRS